MDPPVPDVEQAVGLFDQVVRVGRVALPVEIAVPAAVRRGLPDARAVLQLADEGGRLGRALLLSPPERGDGQRQRREALARFPAMRLRRGRRLEVGQQHVDPADGEHERQAARKPQ